VTTRSVVDRAIGGAALALAALAPLIFSDYWVGALLTQTLFLGIVASSLIFLSAYGGMVSLAQVALYGIAGFVLGNVVTNGNFRFAGPAANICLANIALTEWGIA